MPQITLAATPVGLLVDVILWISEGRRKSLIAQGLPVPNSVAIRALVDTGADGSIVDNKIIAQLGIPQMGTAHIHTPTTGRESVEFNQYDVGLVIPGKNSAVDILVIHVMSVIEADFASQGGGYEAVLGRDILSRGILHYNGIEDSFTLAF